MKLAASVEFMHTATLFHDDVVDESDTRRGKRTARLVWGNQESVLVGDFLLGQAFKMMVEVGSLEALEVLSAAAATIAEGEVMQLTTAKNTETTEDEYLDVIRAKTAVLFSAAAEVGAIVAGAERSVRSAFRSYGANLGIAFQLDRRRARLWRPDPDARQGCRRRFPRGKGDAAGRARLPARHARRPRFLEAHAGGGRYRRRRSRPRRRAA